MIKLFGKAIRVNKASQDKDTLDVGANLFIGNLDPDVDEKVCHCCYKAVHLTTVHFTCTFGLSCYTSFVTSVCQCLPSSCPCVASHTAYRFWCDTCIRPMDLIIMFSQQEGHEWPCTYLAKADTRVHYTC